MLEALVLGAIQGIVEWLPVSSEGLLVLAQVNLFGSTATLSDLIRISLFLHMGTFFAALVYFRKDVWELLQTLIASDNADPETRKILVFLVVATLVSGIIGGTLLFAAASFGHTIELTGRTITAVVGVLLLITAWLQLRTKKEGLKTSDDLGMSDSLLLGIVQGLSALPGLSRSGLTISTFLLRGYEETLALRLSFLMSLPIVLGANIILNLDEFRAQPLFFAGLFASFVFGLLTIHWLLRFARVVNFGYFVLFFGLLTLASVFI